MCDKIPFKITITSWDRRSVDDRKWQSLVLFTMEKNIVICNPSKYNKAKCVFLAFLSTTRTELCIAYLVANDVDRKIFLTIFFPYHSSVCRANYRYIDLLFHHVYCWKTKRIFDGVGLFVCLTRATILIDAWLLQILKHTHTPIHKCISSHTHAHIQTTVYTYVSWWTRVLI